MRSASMLAIGAGSAAVDAGTLRASKPSVVFFLTDDQDYIIGGFDKMEKTKRLIGERGATFSNALVHSPICAVSRSELQSGRYLYNIKSNNLPTPVNRGMASAGNGGPSVSNKFHDLMRGQQEGGIFAHVRPCQSMKGPRWASPDSSILLARPGQPNSSLLLLTTHSLLTLQVAAAGGG